MDSEEAPRLLRWVTMVGPGDFLNELLHGIRLSECGGYATVDVGARTTSI